MEPMISLANITKEYPAEGGAFRALRGVTLSIAAGEFVAITGPSGAGKSTLMNVIGCMDRPTSGRYHLAGYDVSALDRRARAVVRNRVLGFIFQGFNLLSRTSALENVELPLVYRGTPGRERRRRATEALDLVGLGGKARNTPAQLSGGQQQRVAIARALVAEPQALVADEPTGNLDSSTSEQVLSLLQWLNRARGLTIVLVTHDPNVARCASRIVAVRDGALCADERLARPRNVALRAVPSPASRDLRG